MSKYMFAASVAMKRMKVFLLDFVGQIVYFPMKFLVIFLLWNFVYRNLDTNLMYSFEEMLGYYFIFSIIEVSITTCGMVTYEEWEVINEGKLNMYLTRPISYPLYAYAEKAGEFLVRSCIGIFFICVTKWIMKAFFRIDFPLKNAAVFFIALFLGFTIMVNLFQIVGHFTFWVENVLSLRDNMWNVIKIFSGAIFPIAMYPQFLQQLCNVLPFQYIYYVPISIFLNKMQGKQMATYIFFQLCWCAALMTVNIFLWRRGNKRYVAQGG